MTALVRTSDPQIWIDRIFDAKIAREGGVVRRSVHHVHREIGPKRLELEVRRRGFHLLQSDGHYVIICNSAPLTMIC